MSAYNFGEDSWGWSWSDQKWMEFFIKINIIYSFRSSYNTLFALLV